jgi:hypothetical protein
MKNKEHKYFVTKRKNEKNDTFWKFQSTATTMTTPRNWKTKYNIGPTSASLFGYYHLSEWALDSQMKLKIDVT